MFDAVTGGASCANQYEQNTQQPEG